MKNIQILYQRLILLSQFGLSLITPLLLCLFFCYELTRRWNIGSWVYLFGFFFGFGGSFVSAWKFFKHMCREADGEKSRPGYNEHH